MQAWDRAGKLIEWGWGGIEKYCPSDIVSPSAWRPFKRSLPYLYGTPSVPHLHTHTTTGMGTPYWQLHEPQPELKHQRFWLQTQGLPDRCGTLDRCLPTPNHSYRARQKPASHSDSDDIEFQLRKKQDINTFWRTINVNNISAIISRLVRVNKKNRKHAKSHQQGVPRGWGGGGVHSWLLLGALGLAAMAEWGCTAGSCWKHWTWLLWLGS